MSFLRRFSSSFYRYVGLTPFIDDLFILFVGFQATQKDNIVTVPCYLSLSHKQSYQIGGIVRKLYSYKKDGPKYASNSELI